MEIDANAVLDYALFQMSTKNNRFKAIAYCKGRSEHVYSGVLEQLFLCVPEAREAASDSNNDFKLQPDQRSRPSWFTKSTLQMFLGFVDSPEAMKKVISVHTELNQLEDTRKFHLTLYTKDKLAKGEDSVNDNEGSKQMESTQKVKVETVSSEVTKNELLRALELRLTALDKELAGIFMEILGTDYSKDEISKLATFVEQFGCDDLGHALQRYLTYHNEGSSANLSKEQPVSSHGSRGSVSDFPAEFSPMVIEDSQKALRNGISPAKIAEAERRSPTESEDSSDSSDGERHTVERSRPVIRSASPRRSASPMRRVQIGRSGSRRPAALTIKSLGFIPAREKPLFKDADSDGEEESSEPKIKPSENSIVRMSVQDRINLFESKQRDQTVDNQKKSKNTEAPFGVKKSVLRRWSSGMGDSSTHLQPEVTADERSESPSENLVQEQKPTDETLDHPLMGSNPNDALFPLEKEGTQSSQIDSSISSVTSQAEEMPDRAAASAEWTRQKEAELNEMLMKMMGNKTSITSTDGSGGVSEPSVERKGKGDFYSQYKEKRDEKLRAENLKKKAEKEAKFKSMHETLEQRRAEMTKKVNASVKPTPSVPSQKPRRNSSPPVLSKKDSPAQTATRKALPKTPSSLPATRKSLPSAPPARVAATPPKSSSGTVRSTVSNRRKPQSTPSPTNPGPRTEKPRQPKVTKATPPEAKPTLKSQEGKRLKDVTKTNKVIRKEPAAAVDNSGATPTKPSFYNKVTRKNSVVPLESKTSVKKTIGTNSGAAPLTPKTPTPQSKDSSKNCATPPIQGEPKQLIVEAVEPPPSESNATLSNAVDSNLDESSNSVHSEKVEADDTETAEVIDTKNQTIIFPVAEIEPVEDLSISSTAWVEAEHQAMEDSSSTNLSQTVNPDDVPDSFTNSRVRHSLSQMLQADNGEPEIIEWGNAENPPSLVYQKDAPKGFKRLLKFARKNKADSNSTGWSSPSAFSDGDEEAQESKYLNKKSTDALSKKTAVKTKAAGKQRNMLAESYDGGNQRLLDLSAKHEILSTSMSSFPAAYKSREGHVSSSNASGKATRSFFSFSNFRSK